MPAWPFLLIFERVDSITSSILATPLNPVTQPGTEIMIADGISAIHRPNTQATGLAVPSPSQIYLTLEVLIADQVDLQSKHKKWSFKTIQECMF